MLEQNAPAALHCAQLCAGRLVEIDAKHLNRALALGQETDDRAHQHRFSAAGAADEAEDLALDHVK